MNAASPVGAAERPFNRLLPMIIGSALFMQTLDSTVIATALPSMARALHEDPVKLNLAITAYLLSVAVFLPISGWMADRFGARTVFRAAIIGFGLSSVLCGLSRNLDTLVIARMLQGCAGAMMVPVGRLVLLRTTPKDQLVRAMVYLTLPAMIGPILGPPLGGFIVTFSSWRWIFFINAPVGLIGVALVSLFVPNIREEDVRRLDVRGCVLTGVGLAGLIYGFENLGRGMLPLSAVLTMMGVGAVCLLLYGRHARGNPHAVLDLSLFRIPTFSAALFGGLFGRLTLGATPFLMALLLQVGFGLSAFRAGLITFAGGVGIMAMRTIARSVLRTIGFRRTLIVNALFLAAGTAAPVIFHADTAYWLIVLTLLLAGVIRALQFTAINTLAFSDVPKASMSHASSLSAMMQQLALSLGVGLAASLIHITRALHGGGKLTAAEISPAFVVIAGLSLIALAFFVRLPADAGREVSGHRVALEPSDAEPQPAREPEAA